MQISSAYSARKLTRKSRVPRPSVMRRAFYARSAPTGEALDLDRAVCRRRELVRLGEVDRVAARDQAVPRTGRGEVRAMDLDPQRLQTFNRGWRLPVFVKRLARGVRRVDQ